MSKVFLKAYSRIVSYPRLFALSQKFAWLGTSLLAPFSDFAWLPAFTGWGYSKDLPRFAGKTFRERWEGGKATERTSKQPETHPRAYTQLEDNRTTASDSSGTAVVARFVEELTKVSGYIVETTENDLTAKIIEFLGSRGLDRVHLEPNVLDEEKVSAAGIAVSRGPDAALRVGITKAICGVADTGSILEADGEGGKLQASLLTEIHLAVLRKSDVYPSLVDAIHHVRGTKSAVFITGPSRTADIEMTLSIGVHGPGEVIVFLVDD